MMWFRSCSKPTRPFSETIFPNQDVSSQLFLVGFPFLNFLCLLLLFFLFASYLSVPSLKIKYSGIFLYCSCLVVSAFPSLCKFDIIIGLLNSAKRRSLVSEEGIDERSIFLKCLRPRLPKELETIPEILLFLFLLKFYCENLLTEY